MSTVPRKSTSITRSQSVARTAIPNPFSGLPPLDGQNCAFCLLLGGGRDRRRLRWSRHCRFRREDITRARWCGVVVGGQCFHCDPIPAVAASGTPTVRVATRPGGNVWIRFVPDMPSRCRPKQCAAASRHVPGPVRPIGKDERSGSRGRRGCLSRLYAGSRQQDRFLPRVRVWKAGRSNGGQGNERSR